MKCPKCGVELKEESKFCPNCGEKLIKEEAKSRNAILKERYSVSELEEEIKVLEARQRMMLVFGIVSFAIAVGFIVLMVFGIIKFSNEEVYHVDTYYYGEVNPNWMAGYMMFSFGLGLFIFFVAMGVACFVVRSIVFSRKIQKRKLIIRKIEE